MPRHKDAQWNLPKGEHMKYAAAQLAVLMDIRDELKELNVRLSCHRFTQFPLVLERIDRRLARTHPLCRPAGAPKGAPAARRHEGRKR